MWSLSQKCNWCSKPLGIDWKCEGIYCLGKLCSQLGTELASTNWINDTRSLNAKTTYKKQTMICNVKHPVFLLQISAYQPGARMGSSLDPLGQATLASSHPRHCLPSAPIPCSASQNKYAREPQLFEPMLSTDECYAHHCNARTLSWGMHTLC